MTTHPRLRPHPRVPTLPCICDDERHPIGTALWHRAWCHWYDHRDRGHEFRAAAWGWLADRLARFA